jgi:hypothetical protein
LTLSKDSSTLRSYKNSIPCANGFCSSFSHQESHFEGHPSLQKLEREFSHLLTNYWTNPLRCYIWLHRAISIILESYCDICLAVITKVLCLHSLSHTHTQLFWGPVSFTLRGNLLIISNGCSSQVVITTKMLIRFFRHARQFFFMKPENLKKNTCANFVLFG